MTFYFWARAAKITLVLRFMKSNNFYYVQTAKVINSKKILAVKGSNFVRSEEFSVVTKPGNQK